MPILMMTPDMIADTWLGATACALGSQTCSGMMPAFEPKPDQGQHEDRRRHRRRQRCPGSSGASVNEPLAGMQQARRGRTGRGSPVCVATR